MSYAKNIGSFGEKFVSLYLTKNNIKLLDKNFHSKYGEIDIIAEDSQYIIFIEVKTRKFNSIVSGMESVNFAKMNKIIRTSYVYLQQNTTSKQPRFDVIEIYIRNRQIVHFNHIKNAFDMEAYYEIF